MTDTTASIEPSQSARRPRHDSTAASRIAARAKTPRELRRLRLITLRDVDGRSIASIRARSIVAELLAGWPDATPLQRQAVDRAAMLAAIAEDLAARRLTGLPVSLADLLKAEGVAKRAVQAVLDARPRKARRGGLPRLKWGDET